MMSVKRFCGFEREDGTTEPIIDFQETEIPLKDGVTPIVEVLLRDVCRRSGKVIGLTGNDEAVVVQQMTDYRRKFDDKFNDRDYLNDARVRSMARILDFCYKVGFQPEIYLDDRFFWQRNGEELIRDFCSLMRLTLIALAEEHNLIPYLQEARLSLIKGGKQVIMNASEDLADKIVNHTLGSTAHLKASMVLLLQIFQSGQNQR